MKTKLYLLPLGLFLLLFAGIAAAMPSTEASPQQEPPQGELDSHQPPSTYHPIPVEPTKNDGFMIPDIAVFMDFLPWGSNELINMLPPTSYDIYSSADFVNPISSNYKLVIIAADQNQNFYDLLAANMNTFEDYLQDNCGVLQAHTAGWGWNGGDPSNVILPGGVTLIGLVADWDNYHNNTHDSVTTPIPIPDPFTGTFASHGHYDNLVAGTDIIATENITSPPTLIEYPFGQGLVVAGMQPFSFGAEYSQDTGDLLENLIEYTYNNARPPCQPDEEYVYSVKFVCGSQGTMELGYTQVVPGLYSTEINIHNFNRAEADIRKHVIPLVRDGQPIGREPHYSSVQAQDAILLPPDTATMDDCYRLAELIYGNPPPDLPSMKMLIGYLEIISPVKLHIDAVYTTFDEGSGPSIDVERVEGTAVTP